MDYSKALDNNGIQSQAENAKAVVKYLSQHKQRLIQRTSLQEFFHAYENARAVKAAEAYFRQVDDNVASWNVRDSAFMDTIQDTMMFLGDTSPRKMTKPRVIVWAHNSHVGDARGTQHARRGIYNVGQLCRETFGENHVYIVGFTTYDGTVRAAREWGGHDGVMKLNRSFESSYEYLLHSIAKRRRQDAFGYILRNNGLDSAVDEAARKVLDEDKLERFVGLAYTRETELRSHYSTCRPSEQYDCLLHIDHTTALSVNHVNQH
jgi:erythromycin esterase-like protein